MTQGRKYGVPVIIDMLKLLTKKSINLTIAK